MKKFLFLALSVAIVTCAAVFLTGCKDSTPKIPEGTAIGEFRYFEQTDEATGLTTISFIDAEQNVTKTTYTALEDHQDFIVATDGAEGNFALLNLKGSVFAVCESFKVLPLYEVDDDTIAAPNFIKVSVKNGNHLAFSIPSLERLENIEGIKEDIIPLANGDVLFKQEGKWGIASGSEIVSTAVCTAVAVIATKNGKVLYWIKRPDYTGVINREGKAVKRMSVAQFKQLKRKAKTLWEEGSVTAIWVKKI